jgi:putative ABC transport system permease protein
LKETLAVALIGSVVGIALTYLAHWIIENVARSGLTQEIVYGWWPIAVLIAVAGSVLGTLMPAVKAIRQDVVQALAYE